MEFLHSGGLKTSFSPRNKSGIGAPAFLCPMQPYTSAPFANQLQKQAESSKSLLYLAAPT